MNDELLWESEMRDILFTDDNYFEWLSNFTLQYDSFSDDTWLYRNNEITEKDQENVKNLYYLYEVVDDYATKNYIFGEKINYGHSYDIKYQDSFYQISFMQGQGGVFSIDRKSESDNYIDYDELKENKKTKRAEVIDMVLDDALKELSSVVQEDQVEEVVYKKLSKIKKN